jgi:hypothetical protein
MIITSICQDAKVEIIVLHAAQRQRIAEVPD